MVEEGLERLRGHLERVQSEASQFSEEANILTSEELYVCMLVTALSSHDTEMVAVLLMETERYVEFFGRGPQHLKMKLRLPKEVLDRATDFVAKLNESGLFSFPQEIERFLSQLLSWMSTSASQTEEPKTSRVHQLTKEEAQIQLWEGVKKDDGQLVEGAVLSGADLEEERGDRMTALSLAARDGRLKALRALVKLRARLEGIGGWVQWTSLQWASYAGRQDVVRELLAAGADPEVDGTSRWMPLHFAAANGHLPITRLLVEAGAGLNPRNRSGDTPLGLAERNAQTSVAVYLRSLGATK